MRFAPTVLMKLACCVAWAALALSAAAPANAKAMKDPSSGAAGDYASCSSSWTSRVFSCGMFQFNYDQTIKFITSPCGSGACSGTANTAVESTYPTGRKSVAPVTTCYSSYIVELNPCGC